MGHRAQYKHWFNTAKLVTSIFIRKMWEGGTSIQFKNTFEGMICKLLKNNANMLTITNLKQKPVIRKPK